MRYIPHTHTFDSSMVHGGFFTIAFQMTRNCNYRCVHCSESDCVPALELPEMLAVADAIIEHGVKRVNVSGGEPTLRDDWQTIIRRMSSAGVSVSLATNCSMLDKATIRELVGSVANIRVSLYGAEAAHNSITRCDGSFRRVCEAASDANDVGIPVYACMALMQSNLLQIGAVRAVCLGLGIEKLLIYSLVPKGRGAAIFRQQGVTMAEVMPLVESFVGSPEVYWSPFDQNGICALIQADGSLVATPYFDESIGVKHVGYAHQEPLSKLWERYPFKENYLDFNRAKLKC